MSQIGVNENHKQLLFLYRSYKLVQETRISFDNTERNFKRDWNKYVEEIGQDPLELVWNLGSMMKKRFFGQNKEENPWSEKYWIAKMTEALKGNRTYIEYLNKKHGFGSSVLSCGILGMIGDPTRFKGLQSLWHYCGLHVVDGKAPKRERGKKIDWNPYLKSLLLENLGKQLISKKSEYRTRFEEYRKQEQGKGLTKGHVFNRARRKIVKDFLKDLWNYWFSIHKAQTPKHGFPKSQNVSVNHIRNGRGKNGSR